MKRLLISCLLASAAAGAQASEYGCKVLLCLANPASNGGPKGVAECVPPINQLYDDLAHGRSFPSCDMSDGNDGANYAVSVFDPYDPCPPPLQAAPVGSYVVQGQRASGSTQLGSFAVAGQPQVSQPSLDFSGMSGPRACVVKPVGSYRIGGLDDGYTVTVFDKVVWQQPQSPRAIDVFVNRAWFQRVHW